ncbi:hypothetical protein [Frog virus 3]
MGLPVLGFLVGSLANSGHGLPAATLGLAALAAAAPLTAAAGKTLAAPSEHSLSRALNTGPPLLMVLPVLGFLVGFLSNSSQ